MSSVGVVVANAIGMVLGHPVHSVRLPGGQRGADVVGHILDRWLAMQQVIVIRRAWPARKKHCRSGGVCPA